MTRCGGASTTCPRRRHGTRLVPSKTTLLGLLKHVTYVEGVWFDQAVTGRGERTVWALYLQVLRELAQHAGHADILREQVLARRSADLSPRTPPVAAGPP